MTFSCTINCSCLISTMLLLNIAPVTWNIFLIVCKMESYRNMEIAFSKIKRALNEHTGINKDIMHLQPYTMHIYSVSFNLFSVTPRPKAEGVIYCNLKNDITLIIWASLWSTKRFMDGRIFKTEWNVENLVFPLSNFQISPSRSRASSQI